MFSLSHRRVLFRQPLLSFALLASFGSCASLLQASVDAVVGVPTPVLTGGRSATLPVGQPVSVISSANGLAAVRVRLSDGRMVVAMVPVANLKRNTPPPVISQAAQQQSVESSAASASASPTTAPASADWLLKPGWNTVQLEALPEPPRKPSWFPYGFDPKAEKFTIYVPYSRAPNKACGVVGWTNPGDGAGIPKQFEPLFEEYRLIAVAAERCGNSQESARRAGLLVSAILEVSKKLPVSKDRIVLSGLSGGGRLSVLGVFCHPEIFSGSISWCGGHFYKDYPDSAHPNRVVYGFPTAEKIKDPSLPACVAEAKKKAKFVLLTGPNDFNLQNSHDIETVMNKEHFQVRLIEEPGLGHSVGSVDTMREALEFILGKPPAP